MLVSVVVPLYNYSNFIVDCVQSIRNQDYKDYEIIIVDDCSTDNSYHIARGISDAKTKVIRLDVNSGYSKAKNEGIILSQGELITCLDADDMLTMESITPRVKAHLDTGIPFIHANAITVKKKVTLAQCYKMAKAGRQTPRIHAQTVMVTRDVYRKFGLYDEGLRSRSDKEMWWRLFGKNDQCKFKVQKHFIKKDVAYYRLHNTSMMAKRRSDPKLQKKLTRQLEAAYQKRLGGITKDNTRFLGDDR